MSELSTGGQQFTMKMSSLCNLLLYVLDDSAPLEFNILACSAMDSLAQSLMKDAVNCDKHSDLQNSANQLDVECGLCFWVFPESRSPSLFDNGAWADRHCPPLLLAS